MGRGWGGDRHDARCVSIISVQDSVWGEAPDSILQTPVMTVMRWPVAGMVPLSAAAGHRLLLWAGRGRTGLNVIYSGTGEVVMVTPSQVRSETSSETLKLNIQLKLTSTRLHLAPRDSSGISHY